MPNQLGGLRNIKDIKIMTTTSTVSTSVIQYDLVIHGVAADPTNIVTRVYWELSGQLRQEGTDHIHRDAITGWVNLVAGPNITPFAELTEAQVLQWVRDTLGANYEKYRQVVELYVQRLADDHNVEYKPFPWEPQ